MVIIFFVLPFSLSAQFYYFGHNKVQYAEFDWQILRTEHFDVYYYPEMKELAQQGAFFAEEAYKQLESKFNHSILHRIPLIFYSSHIHFEQTNTTPGFIPEGVGGFFEFMKGRVVIPADGSLPRFRHVIRHELVHVFMYSKISRVMVDHRLPQDRMPPLWFSEGLAEHWSTVPDDQAEMVIRDAVLNNYLVPLSSMEQIYGTFLMYKEGQNLLGYIEEKYGEDKILLLLENFWRSSKFSDVMKATIGKEYQEFDEEWTYWLKKKYYPVLAQSDFSSIVSSVVVKKGFNTKPVFYNNNGTREVYFIGNYTGYTSIYKVNLDANTKEEKEKEPEVVVVGEKTDEFEAFHLFQSKMDISQKGMLAFVTKRGESDALHLYDLKEQTLYRTLQFENLVVLSSPNWSQDAKKIIFNANDKCGRSDLYLYDFGREELTRLTDDAYDDRDPVWSPNQQEIIFSSDRTPFGTAGVYNLFSFNCTTKQIQQLTNSEKNFYSPSFSSDGTYLLFTSNQDGAQNIWTIPTAELHRSSVTMTQVSQFTNAAFDPRWTDNNEILFSGFENYNFKIFTIKEASAVIDSSSKKITMALPQSFVAWKPQTVSGDTSVRFLRYNGTYALDIAQSQVSTDPVFGTYGGAAMAISDMLGNDQYYFLLYNNAQTSSEFLESFNIAVSRISLGQRTNYASGIFHFAGRRYDLTDPDLYYYERLFGGYYTMNYPLSKFRRIEWSVSLSNSDKDTYFGFRPRKALILSNSLSFVHDNSLWGPTGPIDGSRFLVTVAYTRDIQYNNVAYYTFMGDYRVYNRLSTRTALASRLQFFANDGKEARRFFMGGSWDLRGWTRWSLRGKKLWLTSHEFRFPFVDQFSIRFPFGNIGFSSIRGALFVDAGSVWDEHYKSTIGSFGTGIRWNLFGAIVLRYDVGKRILSDFNDVQSGLFYQFFFGWDF